MLLHQAITSFIIAKTWKHPKGLSAGEWMKVWQMSVSVSLYITQGDVINNSAMRRQTILPFATTWMDLEGIMLSEIHPTEKEKCCTISLTFVVVQLLSHIRPFVTPWTAVHQASLSLTTSWSLPKLMSIESVVPSSHLILCHLLLLLPSVFPSLGVFSNELAVHIRWPKYWNFSFSISPSNEYPSEY